MSVAIKISDITPNLLKKLDKDLHIKPIVKEAGFGNNSFPKASAKPVEAFDQYSKKGVQHAVLPFSYYFQNLENVPRIESECESREFDFVGNLLPRQNEVKKEVIEILNRTGSVVLSLHTGFGKTVMAIYLASKVKLRTASNIPMAVSFTLGSKSDCSNLVVHSL